jgi:hypothetical protein
MAEVVATRDPEISVATVVGIITVSVVILAGRIEAGMVDGGIVVPGDVVVYVIVISLPRALAGIAEPTPEAVYWLGIGSVDIFGGESSEYMLPVDPFTRVYRPVIRFARSPEDELYAPET